MKIFEIISFMIFFFRLLSMKSQTAAVSLKVTSAAATNTMAIRLIIINRYLI